MEGHLQVLEFFHRNFHSFYFRVHQHAAKNMKICTMQKFNFLHIQACFYRIQLLSNYFAEAEVYLNFALNGI